MLSRTPYSMHSSNNLPDWDIFCNVIDNYGDIGVCWRLARQLTAEYGLAVRLWVDDLTAFKRICPEINSQRGNQYAHGVEVRLWKSEISDVVPGGVVIEAFACHLPERFISAMVERNPKPVWINLDYLSAEDWVSGCHALPSPHPRLPLIKHFFFPGFTETTGGLLREGNLEARRQAYSVSSEQQTDFWQALGLSPPSADALIISLFSYETPTISGLLDIWAQSKTPICCLIPVTRSLSIIESVLGRLLQAGDVINHGNLEVRVLPFVAQPDYDRLLWSCDINFVRGEDSFVRAQWAAKPMVWNIYPQDDDAHLTKLGAFIDVYCAGMQEPLAALVRRVYFSFNGDTNAKQISTDLWTQWMDALPDLQKHAMNWAKNLSKQKDLCSNLVRYCRSKL